jgi:hypothetical protein
MSAHKGTWRLKQVERWCDERAPGRPITWIDDELGPVAETWAARRGQVLLIATRADEGSQRNRPSASSPGLPR